MIDTGVSFRYYLRMRLALSLGLWLAILTALVLGTHGWIQLRAERAELTAAAKREMVLVTTAVRSAVENALRDDQEPDVMALLEQLELKDPAVDVFVFEDDVLLGSSRGSEGKLPWARLRVRGAKPGELQLESLDSGELVAVAPLRIGGAVRGQLVIVRPSHASDEDLAGERRAIVLSIGVLVGVLSAVIWVVVHLRVHRPMSRVISGVRRFGAGDLSARIGLSGRDEVAELAHEFDVMAQSLEDARRRLSDAAAEREKLEVEMQRANRLAIVGEIAATLAHEIGSPLQVLNGRARDLAARPDLPADARRSASILVEQTHRVHGIVERLLDVARRKVPQLREVDAKLTIHQVVDLLSAGARQVGVRFEVACPEGLELWADPAQLQQVLLNLLQNALRACARGGTVRVHGFRSSFARPAVGTEQPAIAIAVEDTGIGIADEVRDRVFEPFFTAWEHSSGPSGTGLGLSVVQSIVTDHGGIVSAEQTTLGARFVVMFPVLRGSGMATPEVT